MSAFLMLTEYVDLARKKWLSSSNDGEALEVLHKAGGVIIRAMNNRHDKIVCRNLDN
jgi:hypothetical protein